MTDTLDKHHISTSVFPVSPQASLAAGFPRDTKGQGGKLRIRKCVLGYFFIQNKNIYTSGLFTEPAVIKLEATNFLHLKQANSIVIL